MQAMEAESNSPFALCSAQFRHSLSIKTEEIASLPKPIQYHTKQDAIIFIELILSIIRSPRPRYKNSLSRCVSLRVVPE